MMLKAGSLLVLHAWTNETAYIGAGAWCQGYPDAFIFCPSRPHATLAINFLPLEHRPADMGLTVWHYLASRMQCGSIRSEESKRLDGELGGLKDGVWLHETFIAPYDRHSSSSFPLLSKVDNMLVTMAPTTHSQRQKRLPPLLASIHEIPLLSSSECQDCFIIGRAGKRDKFLRALSLIDWKFHAR
ncbi:hypothetical protein RJZ57_005573 [Blastomyces gilchristii]